jgi:spore germination cell wall hydrolase CwlJ-like protein
MALGVQAGAKRTGGGAAAWAWLALLLPIASCVPAAAVQGPAVTIAVAEAPAPGPSNAPVLPDSILPPDLAAPGGGLAGLSALAANAAMPVAAGFNPAAATYAFRAATPVDQLRSLDCLAQAVYYEAGSESEDGQRAVAQVVLNRVRHPAWPNSVCGVVYQGAMRAGGGCQFTFTCDGSLARAPQRAAWDQARRIAADALAGRTFAAVGLSTFYHANYVFPAWAPRLVKTAVIGAHNFYRLPGVAGLPGAFSDAYAGLEPLARGSSYLAPRAQAIPAMAYAAPPMPPAPALPSDIPPDPRWAPSNLPEPTIREEYRQSGQWREDAPAAVTGR